MGLGIGTFIAGISILLLFIPLIYNYYARGKQPTDSGERRSLDIAGIAIVIGIILLIAGLVIVWIYSASELAGSITDNLDTFTSAGQTLGIGGSAGLSELSGANISKLEMAAV